MYPALHFLPLSTILGSIVFILFATVLFLAWWGDRKERILWLIDPENFSTAHPLIVDILTKKKSVNKRTLLILQEYLEFRYEKKLSEAKNYNELIIVIKNLIKDGKFRRGGYGLTNTCPGTILSKKIETIPMLEEFIMAARKDLNVIELFAIFNRFKDNIDNKNNMDIWKFLPEKLNIAALAHRANILIEKDFQNESKHDRHFLNHFHNLILVTINFFNIIRHKNEYMFALELQRLIKQKVGHISDEESEEKKPVPQILRVV